jgi:hypothetical protein
LKTCKILTIVGIQMGASTMATKRKEIRVEVHIKHSTDVQPCQKMAWDRLWNIILSGNKKEANGGTSFLLAILTSCLITETGQTIKSYRRPRSVVGSS